MMRSLSIAVCAFMMAALPAAAQNRNANRVRGAFDQYRNQARQGFNNYREEQRKRFEEYRRKRNEEFAAFMRKQWTAFSGEPGLPRPKIKELPPVVWDETKPAPLPNPNPLPIEEVIPTPPPVPQPKPVDPIEEVPRKEPDSVTTFSFYGMKAEVRVPKDKALRVSSLEADALADVWMRLSSEDYTNLVYDCLKTRDELQLGDWAYLQMLQTMAEAVCGGPGNEATMLMAYVYCQSGYKMRLAHSEGRLQMYFASRHVIFDNSYIIIDGERFYSYGERSEKSYVCPAEFPQEASMSLLFNRPQLFAMEAAEPRELKSARYSDMVVPAVCNKNAIKFYDSYPASVLGDDFMTRWAMLANSEMQPDVRNPLYAALRKHIEGVPQLEAVERLLNWVQTAFVYEYDEEVWGDDRAFFPEETLFYPYCDCEDRSILFTRLVRDLLGLKCVLVYYPGHLASAVCFTDEVEGDYLLVNGTRYVVCDPTYIGACVGRTMPGMDNASAKVILLSSQRTR